MKILTNSIKILALLPLLALGVACAEIKNSDSTPIAQASPELERETPPGPPAEPNITIPLERQSGTCPETVGVYSFLLPYEGGADHLVVAETQPFANQTKLAVEEDKFVEYQSNLSDRYLDCIAQAQSESPNVYNFEFREGKLYFRVNLRDLQAPYQEILFADTVTDRPYVRWAIAD
ncbi:MAG: hypothetical protein SAL07_12555 [Oscillatoria sp. PMC 1051.18]|nr:hypothetical protein [Oscillatoria sp. PMC 1050.18]MEC5030720.1 hypothetical protein [Oscillatoria sp. PMC 1051.18]